MANTDNKNGNGRVFRNNFEKAAHKKHIAEGLLAGKTQLEIAQDLGISRQTVQLDAKKIKEEYLQQATRSIEDILALEIARLMLIYREAMEAYQKSKKEKITTTTRTRMKMSKKKDGKMEVEQTGDTDVFEKKEQGIGDPAFLNVALQVHDKVAKLYSLQGQTITHQGNVSIDHQFADFTDEALDNYIEELQAKIKDKKK